MTLENLDTPAAQGVMVAVAAVVMAVGTLGNLATLATIAHIRRRYPSEFSFLQLPAVRAFANLCLCDLVYCGVGLPHMIHAMAINDGEQYWLGEDYSWLCYTQGLVRNLAVVADFITMAVIAAWAAVYQHCKACSSTGGPHQHYEHSAVERWSWVAVPAIWVLSLLTISPTVAGVQGQYRWSGTVYGCDVVNKAKGEEGEEGEEEAAFHSLQPNTNWGPRVVVLLCLLVMLVSYSILYNRIQVLSARTFGEYRTPQRTRGHTAALAVLLVKTCTYLAISLVRIVPAFTTPTTASSVWWHPLKNLFTALYWSMYGMNFCLYLVTSERMRAAYRRSLTDLASAARCRRSKVARPVLGRPFSTETNFSKTYDGPGEDCDLTTPL